MKEINNFSFQTSLCLADGVSFPHKNGQNWVVGRMDSFSPVFVSDLKRGNYFSALEMLSNAINRGRAETEKKKSLKFLLVTKILRKCSECSRYYGRSTECDFQSGYGFCSRNDGFKLKIQSWTFIFKFRKEKKNNQLSDFILQVHSLR